MSLLEKLIVAGVLAAVAVGGWFALTEHYEGLGYARRVAEEQAEAARIGAARAAVTTKADATHVKAAERIKVVTVTQIKEVPTYVSDSDCPLSPGFRVLHDAAAAGELPDPARIADAAAVPAPALASTVVENYGACKETSERLDALQQWIRAQQAVH